MAMFTVGLGLIVILSLTSAGRGENHCPPTANGFVVNSLQGNGYTIHATNNPNEFSVSSANGYILNITIGQNGFLLSGVDSDGNKLTINSNGLEAGQFEIVAHAPEIKPCESESFPEGYRATIGIGAHKLHTTAVPWNDARNTCINEGGHLAVIRSDTEEKVILKLINDAKLEHTWLGLHDLFAFRDWISVQDVRLNETGWATWSPRIVPNPDNYGGNQHCVRLLNTGGMDDIQCASKIPFVCKIECDTCKVSSTQLLATTAF